MFAIAVHVEAYEEEVSEVIADLEATDHAGFTDRALITITVITGHQDTALREMDIANMDIMTVVVAIPRTRPKLSRMTNMETLSLS